MKTLIISAVVSMMAFAAPAFANGPCSPGNAVFCDLQGPQGPKGDTGAQGPAGQDGKDGATGPQGPQGVAGVGGTNGRDGLNGTNGLNGINADTKRVLDQMAADRAVGTLQTRTPTKGSWTGAIGLSGSENGADGLSVGARYGISNQTDFYGVLGRSFDGAVTWGVGFTHKF